eukprot:gnl/Dysnectes_brevis/5560_a8055_382.p1 GENE.gnl/Dysnectes_brevis/5560_a8055_382~~gnl/Dysnectes_brevis/5560_a8055_382.p1  ORF type:complete len:868 (-),score=143.03 gnl/Dysnectes_brevis/5560_a8055_382:92-2695(-)
MGLSVLIRLIQHAVSNNAQLRIPATIELTRQRNSDPCSFISNIASLFPFEFPSWELHFQTLLLFKNALITENPVRRSVILQYWFSESFSQGRQYSHKAITTAATPTTRPEVSMAAAQMAAQISILELNKDDLSILSNLCMQNTKMGLLAIRYLSESLETTLDVQLNSLGSNLTQWVLNQLSQHPKLAMQALKPLIVVADDAFTNPIGQEVIGTVVGQITDQPVICLESLSEIAKSQPDSLDEIASGSQVTWETLIAQNLLQHYLTPDVDEHIRILSLGWFSFICASSKMRGRGGEGVRALRTPLLQALCQSLYLPPGRRLEGSVTEAAGTALSLLVGWLPECSEEALEWCHRALNSAHDPLLREAGLFGFGCLIGEATMTTHPVIVTEMLISLMTTSGAPPQSRIISTAAWVASRICAVHLPRIRLSNKLTELSQALVSVVNAPLETEDACDACQHALDALSDIADFMAPLAGASSSNPLTVVLVPTINAALSATDRSAGHPDIEASSISCVGSLLLAASLAQLPALCAMAISWGGTIQELIATPVTDGDEASASSIASRIDQRLGLLQMILTRLARDRHEGGGIELRQEDVIVSVLTDCVLSCLSPPAQISVHDELVTSAAQTITSLLPFPSFARGNNIARIGNALLDLLIKRSPELLPALPHAAAALSELFDSSSPPSSLVEQVVHSVQQVWGMVDVPIASRHLLLYACVDITISSPVSTVASAAVLEMARQGAGLRPGRLEEVSDVRLVWQNSINIVVAALRTEAHRARAMEVARWLFPSVAVWSDNAVEELEREDDEDDEADLIGFLTFCTIFLSESLGFIGPISDVSWVRRLLDALANTTDPSAVDIANRMTQAMSERYEGF